MSLKDKIRAAGEILAKVAEIPEPALGIDLDGTVDEAPGFFEMLTNSWSGPVYVITYRDDEQAAREYAESFGVRFTEVICVRSLSQKASWIKKLNVQVYFDDMDEVLMHVPEGVKVFKVRNGGNYDFGDKKWLYSDKTGRKV